MANRKTNDVLSRRMKQMKSDKQTNSKGKRDINVNGFVTGQVYGVKDGAYITKCDETFFSLKPRGKIKNDGLRILVGDFVLVNLDNFSIENVLPRKSVLVRPRVANIDQLLICITIMPEADLFIADRLIILAVKNNIEPIIVITKSDLNVSGFKERIEANYKGLGLKILTFSTSNQSEAEKLLSILSNKTTAIAGQSGVGKSSLINAVENSLTIKTSKLSKLNRGKNTTSASYIYEVGNAKIFDTPGFSVVDLNESNPIEFLKLYPDIYRFSNFCKYKTCNHLNKTEQECGVVKAINTGDINKERFERFMKDYQLLVGLSEKHYKKHKKEIKKDV